MDLKHGWNFPKLEKFARFIWGSGCPIVTVNSYFPYDNQEKKFI